MKKKIYLDYAATTPVSSEVFKAMKPYFSQNYGNPSETHYWGQKARAAIDKAREQVAVFLGAEPQEIIFTSGATEAINLAHKGLVENHKKADFLPHIITSSIEHKAVLETCSHLEKLKMAEVTYLPVNNNGVVQISDLEKAIKSNTILVSIIYVNNETGVVQPIAEIGQNLKKINSERQVLGQPRIYFHTDATQAIQYFNCQVNFLGVDYLSLSGHKFYAPKGVGVLYFRQGAPLKRQQDGGGQEYRLRAGTENVPSIVALGQAIEIVKKQNLSMNKPMEKLRGQLIAGVLQIKDTQLIGAKVERSPHIASFLIDGVEGEAMLLLLSEKGIAVSSGSACTSGLLQPSHVLTAMGILPEKAHGSLRFSLGNQTKEEEIKEVIKVLPGVISFLRRMAPDLSDSKLK
jgi:cysteine desulfurase